MPEIILITLAKNIYRILKNKVRNKKFVKGVYTPLNPSPIKRWVTLNSILSFSQLNGRGTYWGGVYIPHYERFLISDIVLQGTKNIFVSVIIVISGHLAFDFCKGIFPDIITTLFQRVPLLRLSSNFTSGNALWRGLANFYKTFTTLIFADGWLWK